MSSAMSDILQSYYARNRETVKNAPAIREQLKALGVVRVRAEYDGVGDSGQIEDISYHASADGDAPIQIEGWLDERVRDVLYALLEVRHGGWENNDGAFGTFEWNLTDDTMEHEHSQRFTDHETFTYEGFEDDAGEEP